MSLPSIPKYIYKKDPIPKYIYKKDEPAPIPKYIYKTKQCKGTCKNGERCTFKTNPLNSSTCKHHKKNIHKWISNQQYNSDEHKLVDKIQDLFNKPNIDCVLLAKYMNKYITHYVDGIAFYQRFSKTDIKKMIKIVHPDKCPGNQYSVIINWLVEL